MNQWLINIPITGPQYASRLAMCHCLNIKYDINGVYRHSLAHCWKLVKVPKHRRKGLWLPVSESGKRFFSFLFSSYFKLMTKKQHFYHYLENMLNLLGPYYQITPIYGNTVDQLCGWCTVFLLSRKIQALQTPTVHCYCCRCYDLLISLSKSHTSVISTDCCASLENAAQLATREYKTGEENQLLFSSCHG